MLQKGMGEKQRWGYPILGAVIGGTIVLSYIWSQFYPYLMELYQVTEVAPLALAASVLGFGNMLIAPPVTGIILDRWGPKATFTCCAIYMAIGIILLRLMLNFDTWGQAAAFWYSGSFFVGLACGTYAGTAPATSAKWFPDRFGSAVGIANIGPGIAALWLAPFTASLIPKIGIGNTFMAIGIIAIVIIIALGIIPWRSPAAGWQPTGWEPPTAQTEEKSGEGLTFKEAMGTKEYWFLWACTFIVCLAGFLFVMNLAMILIEGLSGKGGMDDALVRASIVPLTMSVTAIINAVSRPVWGWVMDKIGSPWKTLAILYVGFALTLVLFLFLYSGPVSAIIGACLVYLFFGGTSPVHNAAGPYIFGTAAAGKIMGSLMVATGVGWVIGPYFGAALRDITGSYVSPLVVAAILVVVGLILIGILSNLSKKKNLTEESKAEV